MNRVLVTGGTGFIGANLCAALVARGDSVRVLKRPTSDTRLLNGLPVGFCDGDLRNPSEVRAAVAGCGTVYHTAAVVSFLRTRYEEQCRVNIEGTRAVVDACLAAGVHTLVHTSSIAALGYPAEGELATEETPFVDGGRSGYARSKRMAEEEILKGVAGGLHAVIVNPSVVVGERDVHFHGGEVLRQSSKGRLLASIRGGMNIVCVGDVVRGLIAAAEKGRCGERYILCGENLTHREIFTLAARITGRRPPLVELPVPVLTSVARCAEMICTVTGIPAVLSPDLVAGAGRFNWFSCGKAARELGYSFTSCATALETAYRWYLAEGLLT